ncbi:unnamed protein product [Didymodactylos carnosus]|uniref:ZZ-type domain-containing protein n=1 Tax=Didymodactylos carnosus TaxID=1234261 RepID=A0A815JNR4_9BILA|nr:unnamed protein product [Didymodactylos carnosus]CAF1379054.1 unnamed protein product [Didymodactylos carnosus]CAF4086018.1 unnamed protein product [Didymodactylos carnosus]CAF4272318.1 unnamed protein product [Didymodactylos carnosus]
MICGQDTDGGGNVQSGCGAAFNWSQASAYRASLNEQPNFEKFIREAPRRGRSYDDQLNCGYIYSCDSCKQDVDTFLFSCIHCRSVSYCEKCEQNNTLRHHQQYPDHIFKLTTPYKNKS